MADGARLSDRNRLILDYIEFELRQRLSVLALDAWSLRRLGGENPPPPALARILARQEDAIARMAALLNGGEVSSRS